MLGVIFGAMAVMLVLTVPIGVMLLAVALIPSLMDPGFMATVPFVLRNVVGGLNSTPLLAIPCLSWAASLWPKAESPRNCSMYLPT